MNSTDHVEIEVSAVIPCLNEARTLPICIEKIQKAFREQEIQGEIVVADNGSTDESVKIAELLGARVVVEHRKGYGSALMAGVSGAKGKIIVMADADDSYDWSALGNYVDKIREGFDLVMGNRFKGGIEPKAMPPLHRYLGNPMLSTLARLMYRIPIGDFHCGMRAFTRTAFDRMNVRTPGMEFATEMIVNASHAGLRIAEIPTRLYPDKRDRPPHLRSFRDGWRHLRFMLTYAPDWLYVLPGLTMFWLGLLGTCLLSGGPLALGRFQMGIHFLAVFCLLTLLGVNILGFGLVAKVLNEKRCPILPTSSTAKLLKIFTLERGLLFGAALAIGGLILVGVITAEWLSRSRGDMSETVHLTFVGTTVIAVGVNVLFGSFLLYLIRDRPIGESGLSLKAVCKITDPAILHESASENM